MDIFLTLVTNLVPLYLLIGAGFALGRYTHIDRETLINLVLYLCMPVVMFGFVAGLDLKPSYALLPVLIYGIHMIIGFTMLYVGRAVYHDARANLLSMCTAMGNSGYFGLPLILLLFEPEWVGVYMFMLLGGVLYEGTIGYYIAARGRFTVRESIIKVIRFPSVYAISAGLLVNLMDVGMPELFTTYWTYFKGAYVILGMMIIGAALSKMDRLVISTRFLGLVFLGKFVMWPLLALAFVMADRTILHMFDPQVQALLMVSSLVPPAANIAAFAVQFNVAPEKAATTVLAGTVFALFYIPAVLVLTGMQ